MHRCFFAHAISSNPNDPIRSQYAPSFLAGYRSACELLNGLRTQFSLFPAQIARFWVLWTHAFSSSVSAFIFSPDYCGYRRGIFESQLTGYVVIRCHALPAVEGRASSAGGASTGLRLVSEGSFVRRPRRQIPGMTAVLIRARCIIAYHSIADHSAAARKGPAGIRRQPQWPASNRAK